MVTKGPQSAWYRTELADGPHSAYPGAGPPPGRHRTPASMQCSQETYLPRLKVNLLVSANSVYWLNRIPGGMTAILKTQLLLTALIWVAHLSAAVLPSGSELEVRLLHGVGSRVSRVGDPVRAVVIAPVFDHGSIVIPAGAIVSGVVDRTDRLGLGLRHTAARLDLRFTDLHLSDGTFIPIHARLVSVEEARETVSENGVVTGIHPSASFSTGVSGVFALLFVAEPEWRLPVLGFKFLAARSPDAEITFPAGTEMLLRVSDNVRLPSSVPYIPAVSPLTTRDATHFQNLLEGLPQQQTIRDGRYPSDLINIVLIGSQQAVERAFGAAGWHGSERHSVMALYHIYHGMVERMGCSSAAMTNLTLNGNPPDIGFQKGLDTLAKRHHVRFWRGPEPDVWIGAATEDTKYKVRNLHITHDTNPDIDDERAKVVNDLAFSGCIPQGGLISRVFFKAVQQDDRPIFTDGKVAVIRLGACTSPRLTPPHPATRPARAVRVAQTVLEDVARSNPVSVGYAIVTSMFGESNTRGNTRLRASGAYTRPIAISTVDEAAHASVSALR